MKYLACLLLLLIFGCGRNPVAPEESAPPVVLSLEKDVYAPAERLTLRIDNQAASPVSIHDCILLEKFKVLDWGVIDMGWRGCIGGFKSLEPGRLELAGYLNSRLEDGKYRLTTLMLLRPGQPEPESISSAAFSIVN